MENHEIIECFNKHLKKSVLMRLKCCSKTLYKSIKLKPFNMHKLNWSDLNILKTIVLLPDCNSYFDNVDYYKFARIYPYLKAFRNIQTTGWKKNHYNYLITFCIYKYIVMEFGLLHFHPYLSVYGYDLPNQLIDEIIDLHINHPYQLTIENIYSIVNKYDYSIDLLYLIYI